MGRVRFSLRQLLVLATLISVVLGMWVHRSSSQREILSTLREQGFVVQYRPVGKIRSWVGERIGIDFVSSPWRLACNGEPNLEVVAEIRGIDDLILSTAKVSDQDLEKISQLPKLHYLVLNDTDVTDHGIQHLVNLPLTDLDLTGLPITDECVKHLAKIDSLLRVRVSANTITAEGQQRLASALPKCKVLVEAR